MCPYLNFHFQKLYWYCHYVYLLFPSFVSYPLILLSSGRWEAKTQQLLIINLFCKISKFSYFVPQIVLLLRLVPLLPFNMLNYLLSVTPVPIMEYMLASWIGMMVYCTLHSSSDTTWWIYPCDRFYCGMIQNL